MKKRPAGEPSELPFDWYRPFRPERSRAQLRAARESMYLKTLRDHAALLHRLGYSRDQTRARLSANLAWDFELHAKSSFEGKVDGVVDEVYGPATPAPSGAAPRGDKRSTREGTPSR